MDHVVSILLEIGRQFPFAFLPQPVLLSCLMLEFHFHG